MEVMLTMVLSGCVSTLGELPYGVWESEEPYIQLNVKYGEDRPFRGKYERDGEIIDMVFWFMVSHKAIDIYDPIVMEQNPISLSEDNCYFYGTYTYTKDKLKYKLSLYFADLYGYKTITFIKIPEYEL